MANPESIDPNHQSTRDALRLVGVLLVIVGAIFTLVGLVDFFGSIGRIGDAGPLQLLAPDTVTINGQTVPLHKPQIGPQRFWCFFVGLPMLGLGTALIKTGFMGRIARYTSAELTPVATDSINYAAHAAKGGVRELATAVGEGLRGDGPSGAERPCPRCLHRNDPGAKFCSECGSPLATHRQCPGCHQENDADAKFCDNCGQALGAG